MNITWSGSVDRLALERAVDQLPAGYRLVFILRDIEGYDSAEIAFMPDCTIGNIKLKLHLAQLKLRNTQRALPRQQKRR
jgi:RNA polymerase sigma-70 factor (ECF subfamily)